ncbi:MAG: flagellar hook-associated protein FlgK, partial [Epsilonproteobacteria bacterium]|nr:flagellar hook-associated protein FlgK [Campylobacterota bacterium]NPA57416.1 flagellar hook-associated protein FlgK [Campylobacterota bacterium]
MSLFNILSVNAQSLNAFQKGVELTNKNISNVYNKDYSREVPVFTELSPGFGVDLAEAQRIFDQRYFDRYLRENQNFMFHDRLSSDLEGVEAIFNDTLGSGLEEVLDEFYSKLNQLVNEPESMAVREDLLAGGRKLVATFQDRFDSLDNERSNLHLTMEQEVEEINQLTASLAKINNALGSQPKDLIQDQEQRNSLLNERDRILKELSSHIDMKVRYYENGRVDLSTAKGHALVVGEKSFNLSLERVPKDLGEGLTTE